MSNSKLQWVAIGVIGIAVTAFMAWFFFSPVNAAPAKANQK